MGHDEDPIDYILAQVRENVRYLQNKGRVSESAARQISDLLDKPSEPRAPPAAQQRAFSPPSAPLARAPPPPQQQQSQTQYVRALFDYNAPGDLNFRAGDVIELAPSPNDNDDWWTGRLKGQEGLFPSNYVERMSSTPQQQSGPPHRLPPPPSFAGTGGPWDEKPTHNSSAPPFTGYPGQGGPAQPAPPTVIVHADGNPDGGDPGKKKNKFGKLGSTMGNAAAGGVGFGAGAAIGSGIINAIF